MRLKICCLQTVAEAELAASAGADLLGLVSLTLSGKGRIPDETIRAIAEACPHAARPCLLTGETDPEDVVRRRAATGAGAVQLVGSIEPADAGRLRDASPEVEWIKVIHVGDERSIELAAAYHGVVDVLLLDTRVETNGGSLLGGTGVSHDWSLSRRIVDEAPIPVLLAGGLEPSNVGHAIDRVRPDGIDVCSGVRSDVGLDPRRLARFVAQVHAAAGTGTGS